MHLLVSDFSSKKNCRKISRSPSRFLGYAEAVHSTLLFYMGRLRNVQGFTAHVHSNCFAYELFCLVTFSLPVP